jgi:anti-anti-sigma regulatory factor
MEPVPEPRLVAKFVVHGTGHSIVSVLGKLDRAAVVGFDAVVAALLGEPLLVIDVTQADEVDECGWRAIDAAVDRFRARGGQAHVRMPALVGAGGTTGG